MNYATRISIAFFTVGFLTAAISNAQISRPIAKHVILIGLDALSSRGLQKAATPAMNKFRRW